MCCASVGATTPATRLAALALCAGAGCALGPLLFGLREYRGEPHRVEPIGILNEVEFFDDSKGTNVGATVAALQGLGADRKLVLILGGEGKGQDFAPLAAPVARFARAVVLIGRDAPLIRDALAQTGVALVDADSMQAAVVQANQRAHAGDAVLMSPACASFDMFDNYEHRAQVFVAAVADLARDAGVHAGGGGMSAWGATVTGWFNSRAAQAASALPVRLGGRGTFASTTQVAPVRGL
jgi:UDP-N-acetylmuramoylalanine--D-glutamate ligase